MKITKEEAKKIAYLSRLSFTDDKLEEMRQSMESILTYMQELNQYDTKDVEPLVHAIEQYNVLRADKPHQSFSQDQALSGAPEAEHGYFKVPKII